MKYTQIVLVRFLAPTNTLGARIRITHPTLGTSRVIPYNYCENSTEEGAAAWLLENNILAQGQAPVSKGVSILTIWEPDATRLFALFRRSSVAVAA